MAENEEAPKQNNVTQFEQAKDWASRKIIQLSHRKEHLFYYKCESVICWMLLFGLVVLAFHKHMHLKLKQKNIKLNKQMIKRQSAKTQKLSPF